MKLPFILASGSAIRSHLVTQAGMAHEVEKARIDEDSVTLALLAEGVRPRDIADALAQAKARKIAGKFPEAMVLGCDQVLEFDGTLLSKPDSPEDAIAQLGKMQGAQHSLYSAAVLYSGAEPIWRHVGRVKMTMRPLSEGFIAAYVDRNWDSIKDAVGCYKLEEEGVRLMRRVEGDYFHVLGMPLLELLDFLTLRGDLDQ